MYSIGYIVTEDNLGPYPQANFYSGGESGEMNGWENLPEVVPTYFNDVARNCSKPEGCASTLMEGIEKDK